MPNSRLDEELNRWAPRVIVLFILLIILLATVRTVRWPFTLSASADLATIAAAVAAIGALAYTAVQVHQNTVIARAQFLLNLETMFARHDEVHLKLRPAGAWADRNRGPETAQDWVKIEDYMGLFEHCQVMLRQGLIDRDAFRAIFLYRLQNIVANERIVSAKLIGQHESWASFIQMLSDFHIPIPSRGPERAV